MNTMPFIAERVTVPFRLDPALGPSHADVLLVMCEFAIPLFGAFTLEISGNRLNVAAIDIHGGSFSLPFASDFIVKVLDVHITHSSALGEASGTVSGSSTDGTFMLDCDLPLRITLRLDLNGTVEQAYFDTQLTMIGGIDGASATLAGDFMFQLAGYDDEAMKPKFGVCRVLLNANSQLAFTVAEATAALTFAGTSREVALSGKFAVGLDGLEVQVLALSLNATPYQMPGVFEVEAIRIDLDRDVPRPPLRFEAIYGTGYRVRGWIPCRLNAELKLLGFTAQPLSAQMTLHVHGEVLLDARVTIRIEDQIEVNIGDGAVYLGVRAEIAADAGTTTGHADTDSPNRRLYAALQHETTFDQLKSALDHPGVSIRWQAVSALAQHLPTSGPLLLRVLNDDTSLDVRIVILRVLREAGIDAAAPTVQAQFEADKPMLLQLEALLTLAALPGDAWRDACLRARSHSDAVIRSQAAQIVGQRADADETAGLLAQPLSDDDPFVRLCAASATLSRLPENAQAAGAIIHLLETERDMCIQMVGCIAIAQSRSDRARPIIKRILASAADPFVRQAAQYAVDKLSEDIR
jgi:HEAT repeat protein